MIERWRRKKREKEMERDFQSVRERRRRKKREKEMERFS